MSDMPVINELENVAGQSRLTLRPLEGEVFVVDKPLGWSSFHLVKKLRGALTARLRQAGVRKLKVGHAGTLDPLASGVMILCTGKATRRIDELQGGVKEYVAEVTLGATTPPSTSRLRLTPHIRSTTSRKSPCAWRWRNSPEESNRFPRRIQPAKSTARGHTKWPDVARRWS